MSRSPNDLVGRDLASRSLGDSHARRWVPIALVGVLLAALALAALRVNLIRVRYGLAAALRDEQALLEEHRMLTARVRSLHDPARLGKIARERGFARPERVITLDTEATGLPR